MKLLGGTRKEMMFCPILLLISSVYAVHGRSEVVTCPDQSWTFSQPKGLCYKVFKDEKGWDEAQKHCMEQNGNLAIIKDAITENALLELFGENRQWWIGMKRYNLKIKKKGMIFNNGAQINEYKNWANEDPDTTACKRGCAIARKSDGKWSDLQCHFKIPFVCQRPAKKNGKCKRRWSKHENICLKAYHRKRMTYDDARKYCQKLKGELAMPMDMSTAKRVKGMLKRDMYWIGIHDGEFEIEGDRLDDKFTYVDGTRVDGYTNWNSGEPNNYGGREHCGELNTWSNKWNDLECTKPLPYACQVQPN